jgi:threonine dehydrogenase-like Zn-dependent dehydrogenase
VAVKACGICGSDLPVVRHGATVLSLVEATAAGAHTSVDPAEEPAVEAWARLGGATPPVVFEAIGVPGILDMILRDAPARSRLVVVGVCTEADRVNPFCGCAKELSGQFGFGYDTGEFAATLQSLAEGRIDPRPMTTGEVGLNGVPGAFADLAGPRHHCEVPVVPGGGT